MNAQVLTCLSVALAVVTYDAPPKATDMPGRVLDVHSSFMDTVPAKYRSPHFLAEVDMNCTELPLRDLLSSLARQARSTVIFDERKVANTQAALAEPMTIEIDQKIRLCTALGLALERRELAYYVKDGKIVVTNKSFVLSSQVLAKHSEK
ncbi:MAG: hypothetical protein AAGA92_07165 [Planctomycetota bacterium]